MIATTQKRTRKVDSMVLVTPSVRPPVAPGTLTVEWLKNFATVKWDSMIRPSHAAYWLFQELLESTGWSEELIIRLQKARYQWEMHRPRLHLPSQVLLRVPHQVASWIWSSLPPAHATATARFEELRPPSIALAAEQPAKPQRQRIDAGSD
jgi:hypothetical protein